MSAEVVVLSDSPSLTRFRAVPEALFPELGFWCGGERAAPARAARAACHAQALPQHLADCPVGASA